MPAPRKIIIDTDPGQDDAIAVLPEGASDQGLTVAEAIDVRCVEECDADIESAPQRCERNRIIGVAIGGDAVGPAADPPGAKPDFRNVNAAATETAISHSKAQAERSPAQ